MNTLAEIEQAVEALRPEEQEELMRFLLARIPRKSLSAGQPVRIFPVSRGRVAFGSQDVARIEAELR